MPAVDQPFGEVDGREVDKMLCLHFSIMAWFTAATLSSFINLSKQQIYTKRGQSKVFHSIYKE